MQRIASGVTGPAVKNCILVLPQRRANQPLHRHSVRRSMTLVVGGFAARRRARGSGTLGSGGSEHRNTGWLIIGDFCCICRSPPPHPVATPRSPYSCYFWFLWSHGPYSPPPTAHRPPPIGHRPSAENTTSRLRYLVRSGPQQGHAVAAQISPNSSQVGHTQIGTSSRCLPSRRVAYCFCRCWWWC